MVACWAAGKDGARIPGWTSTSLDIRSRPTSRGRWCRLSMPAWSMASGAHASFRCTAGMGRICPSGRANSAGGNSVHHRATRPISWPAGRADDDVSPRSERKRSGVQELQASGARLHRVTSADVVVLGAGVMGASTAWHLARRGVRNVLLLDAAAAAGAGSTGRATGGFRAQYATAINVLLSLLSREKLKAIADDTGVDTSLPQHG